MFSFDNIDHELLMRAVRKHTDCKWVLLYTERWLKTPVQLPDGTLVEAERGTPQGGVISPLLANLFLHYAYDAWMQRHQPDIPFERYADDIVCHCKSRAQAQWLLGMIKKRLAECKLELNEQKTRIVYCKDDCRKGNYHNTEFDFLGFTFQHRVVKSRSGHIFMGFNPAISNKAIKGIRSEIRSWRLHLRSDMSLQELSRKVDPILKGWVNYYGHYFRSRLYYALNPIHKILTKWAMRKYKKFKGHQRRASQWILRIRRVSPHLFAHWKLARMNAAGR